MAVITPTITTSDPHEYRDEMARIETFAEGVHLDFADGEFAPSKLLPLDQAWRNEHLVTHADLVILHAESEDVKDCLEILQENGTRTGIALLHETSVSELQELGIDDLFDHILVFGGKLGFQGGEADLSILKKVKKLREVYPDIEIGWDGGVNEENAADIVAAGVDVLNVGGYFKKSEDPKKAYALLTSLLS
jgi:ribulose-phosphate 3-epimerase